MLAETFIWLVKFVMFWLFGRWIGLLLLLGHQKVLLSLRQIKVLDPPIHAGVQRFGPSRRVIPLSAGLAGRSARDGAEELLVVAPSIWRSRVAFQFGKLLLNVIKL